VAFRELDAKGRTREFFGLENFLSSEWNGVPVHVFDNHNFALAFWLESFASGVLPKGFRLAHVDMHSDLWPNPFELDLSRAGDARYVEEFVNYKTEVGNYIEPALRSGLVGDVTKIEGEEELRSAISYLESGRFDQGGATVLNLDLDFFAPDLDYIPFELKKRAILAFAKRARLITVATSPCFIDQDLALRRFFEVFGTGGSAMPV
jgi:hypothetical protein